MGKALSPDEIVALQTNALPDRPNAFNMQLTYEWPHDGLIRRNYKETNRCSVVLVNGKKCHVQAPFLINGMPRCTLCSIKELNDTIVELTRVHTL